MSESPLSGRLRDAVAADLEARPGIDWQFSVRYSEVDGSAVGWGFDLQRDEGRRISLWFDGEAGTCQLKVPPSAFRRRGLSLTWTDMSDEEAVFSGVLGALGDRLVAR